MEIVSGKVKLRDIFLNNGNWWKLFIKYRHLIRIPIIKNVLKLLVCRTSFLGFHTFICTKCGYTHKAPHSCKSRFCPSCGKKATDIWIQTKFKTLPQTAWQHITFTLPARIQELFWLNRHLFNEIPLLAANILKTLSNKQGFLPGIFLAVHTFGRDLKRNFHLHLSITKGGLSIADNLKLWIFKAYFYHDSIKKMWRYVVINLLRNQFKAGKLKLPKNLKHLKSYQTFNSWLNVLYNITWVVELSKPSKNMKRNVEYLGKYLKRPPIGETRIKSFINNIVTFTYIDHYTNSSQTMSLPALEFIQRLIAHIPDDYFRNIRYYGFLSNKQSGKLLPVVHNLLSTDPLLEKQIQPQKLSWRDLLKKTFNFDPLICPVCKSLMVLSNSLFPGLNLISFHKE
ncbi:IS91 family transposase, partial [bacterium]|nr:IS91 family transposase [bacterium]